MFPTIEKLETLFVNAHLVGMATFANGGKPDYARYAGEIGGVEAQQLALARSVDHKLPDDRAFQAYSLRTVAGHIAAAEKLGIGFGRKGSAPGGFVSFSPPPASALGSIMNNAAM